jgi:hypothetical protein
LVADTGENGNPVWAVTMLLTHHPFRSLEATLFVLVVFGK